MGVIYGGAPTVIGSFNIDPTEMCFVQYMPIKIGKYWSIPKNIEWCMPLIDIFEYEADADDYVYLTVKSVYVEQDRAGRIGWHSDGFGTSNINYIWYDHSPTEFCIQPFELSENDEFSMSQMKYQAKQENIVTYPNKTLLRLDSGVIHRVAQFTEAGYRTFVKISVSKDKYNLIGNAHNYGLSYEWDMKKRESHRNIPQRNIS